MGILHSLQNVFTKKKDFGSVTTPGGLEILSKLVSPELSKTGMLETYRKSLYVFACINKIATKTASIDFEMFKVTNSKGEMTEIKIHPLLDLLYKPNPFQTKAEFMETTIINLKCTGDAFWFKVRNKGGKVVELWNLRPDYISIVSDATAFIKEYRFAKNDGSTVSFAPEDIIHFKYPDPLSQYLGMGPLHPASRRVQTEDYATDFQRNFFLNSARPDAVIKNPGSEMTAEQKKDIRDGFGKRHQGVKNSSKVAILDGGLEYQLISLSQKEMDYIESLRFTRDDILVAFQVPKPLLAIVDDVNRANSETAMYIFLSETIAPEIKRIVDKINEEMTYQDFGEQFVLSYEDPTPENRELELKEYESGLTNNYLLINEVRQREGLAPVTGGWSFYMSIMNAPVGGLSQNGNKSISIDEIISDSKKNEKLISKAKSEEMPKLYNFRGRGLFLKKLEMFEEIEKMVKEKFTSKKKHKASKTNKGTAMFITQESKYAYANYINKKVDVKSEKLKESTDKFFKEQSERVLAKLEKQKDVGGIKTKEVTVTVTEIFDKSSEGKVAIKFITPFIDEFIKSSAKDALSMIAPAENFNDTARIQKLIEKRAEFFAESVNSTTLEKLSATLSEGISNAEGIADLTKRVSEMYDTFPTYRSELVARTEATASNNEGLLEGFKQSEVATGKEWINAGDGRVRDEHQDGIGVGGEIVGLNEKFSNGLQYPSEPNCRCVLGPAFLE